MQTARQRTRFHLITGAELEALRGERGPIVIDWHDHRALYLMLLGVGHVFSCARFLRALSEASVQRSVARSTPSPRIIRTEEQEWKTTTHIQKR